jgi:Flp pilus assembly protein TadG
MSRTSRDRFLDRFLRRCLRSGDASQIVEFALSLPLLVVFVVGIFDFGSAVTLKQKLTNAAREGARVAASDPANDLGSYASSSASNLPVSIADAYQIVDQYLLSEKIADCNLAPPAGKPVYSSGFTWVSIATGAPCTATSGLVLTINRGLVLTGQSIGGANVDVVMTQVTIQYPYRWEYSKVAGLVGGLFTGPTSISTKATAYNEN